MKTIFKGVYFSVLFIFFLSIVTYSQNSPESSPEISPRVGNSQGYQINIDGNVLYDQTFAISGEGEALNSQQNDPPFTDFDCQGADDFVVPELEKWEITEVVAIGNYYNGSGTALDFNIYFYEDSAGVPKTQPLISYEDQAFSADTINGIFTVNLSEAAVLQPGKYWVSVQVYIEIAVYGQWSWQSHFGPILDLAVWRNPPDGYGTGFITWTPNQTVVPDPFSIGSEFAYALLGTPIIVSVEVEVNGPLSFALEQNYPNPFNPSTSIKYSVPENGFVKLSVYNLLGEEVSLLVNEQLDAGFYEVTFNAANLPSGAYFYRLQTGNFVETKKMVLLR